MQCGAAAPAAALKIQKPKRTQKGMQNQSMMLCGPPTWCHTHTHTHYYSYNYNYISCRAAGRNAVTTEAVPGASTSPVPQVPPVRRSPLNVSKDETPQGEWGLRGREAVQAHKTSGVNLQCRLSPSLSLTVLLSFYAFFASALGVCLHVCGYRVFRCSSVLFFWPTRRAKMAAGHNTLAV